MKDKKDKYEIMVNWHTGYVIRHFDFTEEEANLVRETLKGLLLAIRSTLLRSFRSLIFPPMSVSVPLKWKSSRSKRKRQLKIKTLRNLCKAMMDRLLRHLEWQRD